MNILLKVCCIYALLSVVKSSAIPIWELLKKDEKISYIYSVFAKEVEDFCESRVENKNCNQKLLGLGLNTLKRISEEKLDELDPYQRGSEYIIWNTLLDSYHPKSTPNNKSTTTPKPNSYADDLSVTATNDFESQEEELTKPGIVNVVKPPKDFFHHNYDNQNVIQDGKLSFQELLFQKVPSGTKVVEIKAKKPLESKNVYLTGSNEIRLYPDGRPVDEIISETPKDDDLDQYKIQHEKIPNLN